MTSEEKVGLTVILHHDQSKNLDQILEYTKQTGFYRDFPPEGTELVSWFVAMSFGFIIQVRVDPSKLRNLNRFIEQKAWGAFRYEIYPALDFQPLAEQFKKEHS